MINGMLWRFRTGAPWRDVPERYGVRAVPLFILFEGGNPTNIYAGALTEQQLLEAFDGD